MLSDTGPLLLQRVIESGAVDAECGTWLADGLRRWASRGSRLALPACLGLPSQPGLVRKRIRDAWLREAAAEMGACDDRPWVQARNLLAAVTRFERASWPAWRGDGLPPPHATRLEMALHFAKRTGEPMPGSVQAMRNILRAQAKNE